MSIPRTDSEPKSTDQAWSSSLFDFSQGDQKRPPLVGSSPDATSSCHLPENHLMKDPAMDLEPGDVQYIRGTSMPDPSPSSLPEHLFGWADQGPRIDALLNTAEQKLAEAINDSATVAPACTTKPIPVQLATPAASPTSHAAGLTIDDLCDLELDVVIELGRSELLIEDVMKLREGSVVPLDKLAGDPVDILANGRLIARGELLVIDGKFGVRLMDVL